MSTPINKKIVTNYRLANAKERAGERGIGKRE